MLRLVGPCPRTTSWSVEQVIDVGARQRDPRRLELPPRRLERQHLDQVAARRADEQRSHGDLGLLGELERLAIDVRAA